MTNTDRTEFRQGFKDGIPIGIGYLAVGFTLGIAMRNAGLNWVEGFFMSLFNLASAGEYAGVQVILENGSYFQMALMTLVANARYLLMSTAFTQKFSPSAKMKDRLFCGYGITDELFGIAIARKGVLNPHYFYGAILASAPAWAAGTAFGIIMGDILPHRIVSALSVALYGMFLAVIIPPARKDKVVLTLVVISFTASYICSVMPGVSSLGSGTRIIILTLVIAGIAAKLKPIQEDPS